MNCKYKIAVEEEWKHIEAGFQIRSIIDVLYETGVLTKELCSKILEASDLDGNQLFFENLFDQEDGYKVFLEVVLKRHVSWLYERILKHFNNNKWSEDVYKSVLNIGDFPRRPSHYVNRKDKITQVQNVLQSLPIDGKVVLYGMAGSGKSNLAIGVMSMELVLEVFGGKVYWINAGDVNPDQIFRLMSRFYYKLCDEDKYEPCASIDILRMKLQKKIREKRMEKHMLIILDNVRDGSVVDAFDIGCRLLITSQNKNILANESNTDVIEVNGSFKIEETYELFASCLRVDADIVRRISEAKEIHQLCKGHPLSIALFGSQMVTYRDSLLRDKTWWRNFVQMLKKGTYPDYEKAIESCIDSLNKDLREKYRDFAIFPEDVNITSKVLEILWNLSTVEVNDIMTQLENKSLAVSYYSNYDRSYNYGIHVVLLKYLKVKHENDTRHRHRRLIDNYWKVCNDDYAKLPDDNYIYQYIGYHLREAEYGDKFRIYFDLNFVDAKIKAAGVGDLLDDFKMYEREILQLGTKNLLNELNMFVTSFGRQLHDRKELSLVQCALKYSTDSSLKNLALQTARINKNGLYFDVECFPTDCRCVSNIYSLPEQCTFVCFGLGETELLCGTKDGDVLLLDVTDQKIIRMYRGAIDAQVNYLEVSSEGDHFLSLSSDGILSIYDLDDNLNKSAPHIKQKRYNDLYKEDRTIRPTEILKIDNANITSASFCNKSSNIILTGTSDSRIQIWKNFSVASEFDSKIPVGKIKFLLDDDLIVGCEGSELVVYDRRGLEVVHCGKDMDISEIIVIDEDSFAVLWGNSVSVWKADSKGMPGERVPGMREVLVCSLAQGVFLSGFVDFVGMEEKMLYVTSDDCQTWMFDAMSGEKRGVYTDDDSAVASDVFQFGDTDASAVHTFLYRYPDNTVKIHDTTTITRNVLRRKPIFDCYWSRTADMSSTSYIPRTASVSGRRSVEITNNHKPLKDVDAEDKIRTVRFMPCGDRIVCGLANGDVVEYEIKTNHSQRIMRLGSAVAYLKVFPGAPGNSEDALLVTGGDKGDLMIRRYEKNVSLISKCSTIQFEPIAETFYLKQADVLLTVMRDRVIKSWNLSQRTMDVLKGRKSNAQYPYSVTSACMSTDGRLLAITMTNMFDIFAVSGNGNRIVLGDLSGRVVNTRLYCCCFGVDGKLVAFGGEDGNIMVYIINLEKQKLIEFTTLRLHAAPVRHILSSPTASLVFVSVGEQVAWWNLGRLPELHNSKNSKRRSFRQNADSDLLSDISNQSLSDNVMSKIGDAPGKPQLLRSIKLKGSYANSLSASPNFANFVTVDDEGTSYHMKMLNNE